MQKSTAILLFFLSLLVACRQNDLVNAIVIEEDEPIVLVVNSFKGKVSDENGAPVSGATVVLYQHQTTTDAQGIFKFTNVEAPKGNALISVAKPGYFVGSAMCGSGSGAKNFTKIKMLKKGQAKTFEAAAGGNLQWPDGSKISIKPNSLKLAGGQDYNGPVNVFARWLDPSDNQLGENMPGALMARDDKGNEKVLATYGMMTFEMENLQGQKLELKNGQDAELEMPIPEALRNTAPAEIPLWYFDLEQERWLLKGACKQSGTVYICKVPTSGYWNCDIPLEPVCLSGTIFQNDSTPAYYTKVIVEDLTDNFIYFGYTNLDGFFCGSVPKGAPLRIRIEDLCGNVLYTQDIGPFATNTDLPDIYLPNTLNVYLVHVSGQMLDCAGQPVALGQIAVEYPGKIRLFPLNAPGVFDFEMALNCIEYPELQITGYDLTRFKATPLQLHSDTSAVALGVLNACLDPEDYLILQVDADTLKVAPTRFYKKENVTSNWMVLEALTIGGNFVLDLRQYNGIGTYSVNAIFNVNNLAPVPDYLNLNSASPNISINISADDGAYITGTISGTALDLLGQTHTLNGNFKIKKEL